MAGDKDVLRRGRLIGPVLILLTSRKLHCWVTGPAVSLFRLLGSIDAGGVTVMGSAGEQSLAAESDARHQVKDEARYRISGRSLSQGFAMPT